MNDRLVLQSGTNCVICKDKIQGYGNNALPVKDGRCCDKCDCLIVIPARMGNSQMALDLGISLWEMRLKVGLYNAEKTIEITHRLLDTMSGKELVEKSKVD